MDSNGRDVNGELLRSRGLLGARDYTYQELSDYRPAELMVASPWVSNPRTEEQTRYSQAEAVYRRFVYDNYTALDAETNDLMQRIFWDGYDSEGSGIYSAVSHVRDVLKTQVSYDEAAADVPENADPVQYFLTMSRRGNAALYASATGWPCTATKRQRRNSAPAWWKGISTVCCTSLAWTPALAGTPPRWMRKSPRASLMWSRASTPACAG